MVFAKSFSLVRIDVVHAACAAFSNVVKAGSVWPSVRVFLAVVEWSILVLDSIEMLSNLAVVGCLACTLDGVREGDGMENLITI